MKSFFVACLLAVSGCGGSTTDGGLLSGGTGAGGAVGGSNGAGGDAGTGGAAGSSGGPATGGGSATGGSGGAPVGAGGAAGGSGSGATSAGGANSPACNECLAKGCATELGDCANDPTCAACAKPGAALSCFSNQHFDKLLTCSCQACDSVCPSIDCKAVPCLECTGKSCAKQISACEADATCPSCLAKSPPDGCKSNQPAVDLYVCDMKHCAGPCGL